MEERGVRCVWRRRGRVGELGVCGGGGGRIGELGVCGVGGGRVGELGVCGEGGGRQES